MPVWNKALWLAILSFVIAIVLLGWSFLIVSGENEEFRYNVSEIPEPGRTANLSFRSANNWKRYGLVAYVSVAPVKADVIAEHADIPCDFEVRFERDGRVEYAEKLRFRNGRSESLGTTAKYLARVFDFPPDHHEVTVRNLGCDAGYPFVGGALQVQRFGSSVFSMSVLPFLAAMMMVAVGVILSVYGGLLLYLQRRKFKLVLQG